MNGNPMFQMVQRMMMNGVNPQQALMNNPALIKAKQQMQYNNMNPQQYAMQMAKQNGIDINQVIAQAEQLGFKVPR